MKPFVAPGGELEYSVLAALFVLKKATAREVHTTHCSSGGLAYTTIATILDRLHDKGLVSRERAGRAFLYQPNVAREDIERARAEASLGQLLEADPNSTIAALVDTLEAAAPELLDRLAKLVNARRRARRGS